MSPLIDAPSYDPSLPQDQQIKRLYDWITRTSALWLAPEVDHVAPGWQARSLLHTVTLPAAPLAPATPAHVAAFALFRQAFIYWDVDPNDYILQWEIQRKTGASPFETVGFATSNAYLDQDLGDSTVQQYQVRALYRDGTTSPWSAIASATTPANDSGDLVTLTAGFADYQIRLTPSAWWNTFAALGELQKIGRGARVASATSQSIPNATPTLLTFDTLRWDTDGMWAGGTSSRLTQHTAGTWLFGAGIGWDANFTGNRQIYVAINGSPVGVMYQPAASSVSGGHQTVLGVYNLPTTGNYFEAYAYQDSGSARVVSHSYDWSLVLWATCIGVGT